MKNGKDQKKSPTSAADKGEEKETFLDTAVGKINEMFPVPIEREFMIVFLLILLLSLIKIALEIYRASGKSVHLLELHVLKIICMFTKVCFSTFSVAAGPHVSIVTLILIHFIFM